MANNPLSPSSLQQLLETSLKQSTADARAQAQTLKDPYDAIALFVHACMLSVGFRLIGLEDDHRLDSPIDSAENLKPLPPAWNASPHHTYSFRYAHSQSALEFVIKVQRLGPKAVIFGLAIGDDRTASFDIAVKDYTSESFFPYTPGDGEGEEEFGGARKKLRDAYISESRMRDLACLAKINILQKLIPGLSKPGYQEEPTADTTASAMRHQPSPPLHEQYDDPLRGRPGFLPRPHPYSPGGHQPSPPIPAGEIPPGFEDEYEILQPPRRPLYGVPEGGRNPLSIGEDDLNPPGLGPGVPLRGPFFGEGGIPRPGFGGGGGMVGMHPTPDHPMFGGRGTGRVGEYDPRFPPGSRYDPVGPGDAPQGGLRGPRGPGWGGSGGSGPFGFRSFGGYGGGDII